MTSSRRRHILDVLLSGVLTAAFISLQTYQSITRIDSNFFELIHSNFPRSIAEIASAILWIGAAPVGLFLPLLAILRSTRIAASLGCFFIVFSCLTAPIGNHIQSINQGGKGLTITTAIFNSASILLVSCILFIILFIIPRIVMKILQRKK